MADRLPMLSRGAASPVVAVLAMWAAVTVVFLPAKEYLTHNTQLGGDYHTLHARRMEFARESLLSHGTLPAWYPRESMGTPFWSNIQNFPLIPTRLVLLAIPPLYAFTVGVMLASLLASLFTFLYARSVGLGTFGAAAAGWTFACAGTHLSHGLSGQLP